jgi:hypothetical protein
MNKNVRLGLVLPLVALTVAWLATIAAAFMDVQYSLGKAAPNVRVSTYVVLAGLAAASLLVLWGFKLIDAEHHKNDSVPVVRATYRFAGLMIVLALAFDVIFAFVTFINSFNQGNFTVGGPGNQISLLDRFLGVYLPIILVAGLIVFVLLQATLFRKSSAVEGSETKGMSETQKALAIGYALPIIGTALAVILGIAVYDAQRSSLQGWTWVLIQLLVGASIVLGTRSAAKARLAKPVVREPRVLGAVGAVTLNYVLSVVFAGVVSIMSFTFAQAAVSSLVNYPPCIDEVCKDPSILTATPDWWINQMIPAFLLLVLVEAATYLAITSRNKTITS